MGAFKGCWLVAVGRDSTRKVLIMGEFDKFRAKNDQFLRPFAVPLQSGSAAPIQFPET